jgi:hypothetical protein
MPKLSRALHRALAAGEINRREANHMQWEADNSSQSIIAKVGGARTSAAGKLGSRRSSPRTQRNNRREY